VQHKQASVFLVGIFVALGLLGILAAVALPHASDMVYQSNAQNKEDELLHIQSAVTEMLFESPDGTLVSIGPVTDLTMVRTTDAAPLVLADFLPPEINPILDSGCLYSFTSEGLVVQLTD
jgi:hypothetical protein